MNISFRRFCGLVLCANLAALILSQARFWTDTPLFLNHLTGVVLFSALGMTVLLCIRISSEQARYSSSGRILDLVSTFYLISLFLVPLLFFPLWFRRFLPSFILLNGLFLIGGLMGLLGLKIAQGSATPQEQRPPSSLLRFGRGLLSVILILAFAFKILEAITVLTGGLGKISPFTGMIIGVLPGVLLLQALALTGFALKHWRNSSPRLHRGSLILGLVLMTVFAAPLFLVPYGVGLAKAQIPSAFGIKDGQWPQEVKQTFLSSPYDASSLFFGLDRAHKFERKKEILYKQGENFKLHFDVFIPKTEGIGKHATILFIHGGGWVAGNTGMATGFLAYLASQGYVVFDIQYRLMDPKLLDVKRELGISPVVDTRPWSPDYVVGEFRIQDMVEDIGDFTKYLADPSHDRFGADLNNVFIIGQSAGAHLSGVSAFGYHNAAYKSIFSDALNLKGVVLFYPPNDMANMVYRNHPLYTTFGLIPGSPETNPDGFFYATPSNLIDANSPPCLIFHGTADKMVPPVNGQMIYEKLRRSGVPVVFAKAPLGAHAYDMAPYHGLVSRYFIERFLWLALNRKP